MLLQSSSEVDGTAGAVRDRVSLGLRSTDSGRARPEARKVMVEQRVSEILERVWTPEARLSDGPGEQTRCPTWDAGVASSTEVRGRAMPP
jgi:hypothetical protein